MRSIKRLYLPLFVAVVLTALCVAFVFLIPKSSSWLHREQNMDASYKIGKIDLWLNGIDDSTTQLSVAANAPTRFFGSSETRDANFDVAVTPYIINGLNKGDIDLKVDLSYTDANSSNNSLYYIFVPADTTDQNFTSGNYRDYLDAKFSGYSLSTDEQRRSAMNSINQAVLQDTKGITVLKEEDHPLYYLLVWSEYDAIPGVASAEYVSQSYGITITAYSYQLFTPES